MTNDKNDNVIDFAKAKEDTMPSALHVLNEMVKSGDADSETIIILWYDKDIESGLKVFASGDADEMEQIAMLEVCKLGIFDRLKGGE